MPLILLLTVALFSAFYSANLEEVKKNISKVCSDEPEGKEKASFFSLLCLNWEK
jgi:hypothetical protein